MKRRKTPEERESQRRIDEMLARVHIRNLSRVPKTVPEGRVVVHNHVRPAVLLGLRGFRAWTQDPEPERLEACDCGWAPEVGQHYRVQLAIIEQGYRESLARIKAQE